jgi:hypothetical protein
MFQGLPDVHFESVLISAPQTDVKVYRARQDMRARSLQQRNDAFAAVIEHFPHRELAIRRLMKSDEGFLQTCLELSAAKAALADASEPCNPISAAMRSEWHDLLGRLVARILNLLMTDDGALSEDRRLPQDGPIR